MRFKHSVLSLETLKMHLKTDHFTDFVPNNDFFSSVTYTRPINMSTTVMLDCGFVNAAADGTALFPQQKLGPDSDIPFLHGKKNVPK